MARRIRIGTSGWNYDHWRGSFYPKDLPQQEWFDYYSQIFDTVEINNTFYHQPPSRTMNAWEEQAPGRFLYAVKANRYLTHMRKLNDVRQPLGKFLRNARRLKSHLGPLLYQLPPNWNKNLERLREFAALLPTDEIHVVEFRNRDWLAEDTFDLMREFRLCLCVHDILKRHPREVTGQAVYVRFHGPGTTAYAKKYRPSALKTWAEWIKEVSEKKRVFAYFNNDAGGYAVRDAETLRDLLAK